jgi:hypothetical protein
MPVSETANIATAYPEIAALLHRLLITPRSDSPEFTLHEKKKTTASAKP